LARHADGGDLAHTKKAMTADPHCACKDRPPFEPFKRLLLSQAIGFRPAVAMERPEVTCRASALLGEARKIVVHNSPGTQALPMAS
jgi:hypothetical protein